MSGLSPNSLAALEERLGYHFGDREMLLRSLTHPSAARGADPDGQLDSYQRLEFLGDRVLGLIIADMLFVAFPESDEGDLHRRHASLVRKETCADVGAELGIGEALLLGESEDSAGGRTKVTILGDACEAVIGAVYVDGGIAPARALIERLWLDRISGAHRASRDAKSTLQEWAQGRGLGLPRYRVIDESGPAHAPTFLIRVELEGYAPETGEGGSKRDAEQAAATAVLMREGIWQRHPE